MSAKPSLLKSPAVLTANPVWSLPDGPVKLAPGTMAAPVVPMPTRAKLMNRTPLVVVARAGRRRAAVKEIGGAGRGAALRCPDQEVVDVRNAVHTAGISHGAARLVSGSRPCEDHARIAGLTRRRDIDTCRSGPSRKPARVEIT